MSNKSGGPTRLQSVMQLQTVRSWELRIKNRINFLSIRNRIT